MVATDGLGRGLYNVGMLMLWMMLEWVRLNDLLILMWGRSLMRVVRRAGEELMRMRML